MKEEKVARPYARALFQLAQARGAEAAVAEHLGALVKLWNEDAGFQTFIRRPEVAPPIKRQVIERAFPDLDDVTRRFVGVVLEKGRQELLPAIFDEFRRLWDEARGILEAEVTAAEALSDEEHKQLSDALSRATGRLVRLAVKEDRGLIGGVVVRIGDRVLDGSLARRLALLGERLRSGDGGGMAIEH